MVDELMMKKSGRRMRRPQDRDKSGHAATFMKRDGTVVGDQEADETMGQKAMESVKRLSVSIYFKFFCELLLSFKLIVLCAQWPGLLGGY